MIRLALAAVLTICIVLPARAAVDIQQVVSPGGITAWLVEEHSIPFTALEIRFMGGSSLDAPGKAGAVNLMTGLLEEGTGDMDAQDFAAAQEALAAGFDFEVGGDTLSISARFLTETRAASIDLLEMAITEPSFAPDAIERVREQVLYGIRADLDDPEQIAYAAFDRRVFGDHPYGTLTRGTLDSVAALTRADLVEAHDRVMSRDHLYVSAVGDITPDELGTLLDDLLGDLPAKGAALPGDADVEFHGGIDVIDYDTPQSVAVFSQKGIARDDPDFFAAFVMNEILGGGGMTSRLFYEVREKRGLTYGVSTWLADWNHAKLMSGQVKSANDKIAEAIEVIRAEWARIAEEGVSEEELRNAVTYLTGAYPLRFDGNARIARILVAMQADGMPMSYIDTRNARIEAVTVEDVKRVAKRLMEPENLYFVVVGRPTGLAEAN